MNRYHDFILLAQIIEYCFIMNPIIEYTNSEKNIYQSSRLPKPNNIKIIIHSTTLDIGYLILFIYFDVSNRQ